MLRKVEFEADCRVVRQDGTIRFIQSRASPVFDASGELREYSGTVIDNTERKGGRRSVAEGANRAGAYVPRHHHGRTGGINSS